jgi:2-amino-4-hydroxy-6-hydroxymethyldihydropteridine diphosphokinase
MQRIWISIGSNIDAAANVRDAVAALREIFGDAMLSPVYETAAVGFTGPHFLNLVAGFTTSLPAAEVVQVLGRIEARFGRQRDEILEYAFVLKPLADVAPKERHPVDGRTYAELWAAFEGDRTGMSSIDFDLG